MRTSMNHEIFLKYLDSADDIYLLWTWSNGSGFGNKDKQSRTVDKQQQS